MMLTNGNQMQGADYGQHTFLSIMEIVQDYCDGLHHGDTAKLRRIFHPDAFLKAPDLRRSLENWLDNVANRPIPSQQGQPYRFKLLSIDIIKDQAMVKLECPLFDYFYIDYLGLLKEDGCWLIVNKMYTDTKEERSCPTSTLK